MSKREEPKSSLPRMPMRDAGGSFKLDNPDDGTPISAMLSLNDRLLAVTKKCTYEVQLADQIDPKRTNPNLPHNVRRKLFDCGIESVALQKILLQAHVLLKKEFLKIDVDQAMTLTLDAFNAFVALDRCRDEFVKLESSAVEAYSGMSQQSRSIGLPSVGNVEQYCITFTQKAHHFGKALLSLSRLFYPQASNWDDLEAVVTRRFGVDDQFTALIRLIKPALLLILHLRDSLEHKNKGVLVRDFSMEIEGSIAPPTVELDFRKSKLPRSSVSSLMKELSEALPTYFQMILVNLASKAVQPTGGFQTLVIELPDENQRARHVRFGYGVRMVDGGVAPLLN